MFFLSSWHFLLHLHIQSHRSLFSTFTSVEAPLEKCLECILWILSLFSSITIATSLYFLLQYIQGIISQSLPTLIIKIVQFKSSWGKVLFYWTVIIGENIFPSYEYLPGRGGENFWFFINIMSSIFISSDRDHKMLSSRVSTASFTSFPYIIDIFF